MDQCVTVKRYGCLLVEQCLKSKYRKWLPAEIFRQRRLSVSAEMEFYRRRAVHRANAATIISRAAFWEPRRSTAPECSCPRLLLMSPDTFDSPVTCMIPLHIVPFNNSRVSPHPCNYCKRKPILTRSSAIAEGPRDASCQLKSCQLPRNSAGTNYTTSPDQIDGMKLEI